MAEENVQNTLNDTEEDIPSNSGKRRADKEKNQPYESSTEPLADKDHYDDENVTKNEPYLSSSGNDSIKHTCTLEELGLTEDPPMRSFEGDVCGIENETVGTTNTTEQQGSAAVTKHVVTNGVVIARPLCVRRNNEKDLAGVADSVLVKQNADHSLQISSCDRDGCELEPSTCTGDLSLLSAVQTATQQHILDVEWHGDVVCVRLQQQFSQSAMSPSGISNACVLISLTACRVHCDGGFLSDLTGSYIRAISSGNAIYQELPRRRSPNLYVDEALEAYEFGLNVVSDVSVFEYEDIVATILDNISKCADVGIMTYVLIFPPDKAMCVLVRGDEIAIFDSHSHGSYGALLIIAKVETSVRLFEVLRIMLEEGCRDISFRGAQVVRVTPPDKTQSLWMTAEPSPRPSSPLSSSCDFHIYFCSFSIFLDLLFFHYYLSQTLHQLLLHFLLHLSR